MKLFFLGLYIALAASTYGQHMFVEYSSKSEDEVFSSELLITDTMSSFKATAEPGAEDDRSFFIKRYAEGFSYGDDRFMNAFFYVKDSLHTMQWELTNDTMTILNELCNSAVCTFRGRTYKAFYTTRYGLSDGPWKFGGLPGLILMVRAEDNFIEWKAVKLIENYTGKIKWPDTRKYQFLSWNDFVKKYIETVKNWAKSTRSKGTVPADSKLNLKLESFEIFYPELQTGKGLTY